MRNGLVFQGGTSTGRGIRDNCEVTAKLPELLLVARHVAASRRRAAWKSRGSPSSAG